MSGLETAIRNALDRSDRSSADIRARIYQSARQALEAGMRKQDISDPEMLALQRQRLEQTIRQIDAEEQSRLQPVEQPRFAEVEPEITVEAPRSAVSGPVFEVAGETRNDPGTASRDRARPERLEPFVAPQRETPDMSERMPERRDGTAPPAKPRRKRRGAGIFSALFIYGMLLAAVGGGAWWLYDSGAIAQIMALRNDGGAAVPEAGASAGDEQFSGLKTLDPQSGFTDDWIDIVKPGEAEKMKAGGAAGVETVSSGDGPAVRLTSRSTGEDGRVTIEIPSAVLQELAGKRSTIALTLQSASDSATPISLACDFSSLGDCGRHRFTVPQQKGDILFQVTFDRSLAPSTPGHLELSADLEGKGRGVNLFAVRILPGQ